MGRHWHRLKRRSDFLDIAGRGLRRNTPAFVVQAKPRPSTDPTPATAARVGFTASRKVGNAVARSRAKRRLRALCDRVLTDPDIHAFDFVLIARTETLTRDFAQMEGELRTAVGRLVKGEGMARQPKKRQPS